MRRTRFSSLSKFSNGSFSNLSADKLGFRRTKGTRFFATSTTGNGGWAQTTSLAASGLSNFTMCFVFQTNQWVPFRGTIAHQWGTVDYNSQPLTGPDSWQLRIYQASGTPTSGSWSDGIIFWIRVGSSFRFMSIPLASVASTDIVQLVIRGRLGLESSPGILAADNLRMQAWLAINSAKTLTLTNATHGDGFGPTTQHPSALQSTANTFNIGGGPYAGARDWDGIIFDALFLDRALSDYEILTLRDGENPADFTKFTASGGSWWRMGQGVGDQNNIISDNGTYNDDCLLTNGGATNSQPVIVNY